MKHLPTILRTSTFALAMALAVTGCKSKLDDGTLTANIQSKLAADNALSGESIGVTVQGGVATLSGQVSSGAARSLAANDAAQVDGLQKVVNGLTVAAPGTAMTAMQPMPTPAPAPPSAPTRISPTSSDTPAPVERQAAPPPPQAMAPPPPPASAAFRNVTLPNDTTLPVRMTQTLDSATAQVGQTFSGTVAADIIEDGLVVIPRGSVVSGVVTDAKDATHFSGHSILAIQLTGLSRHGDRIALNTDVVSKEGANRGGNTATKGVIGAAAGAVLGGIFGGGKGAAIGAAAGGGTGVGINAVTKGQQVAFPSETVVRFHLNAPITVRTSTAAAPMQ